MKTRMLCLIPLALLFACSGSTPTPSPTPIPDSDDDGVPDVLDCAPTDPTIYPDAPETGSDDPAITAGDGKDNDCDETVDEGTDAYDDDGDGFSEDASVGGDNDCNDDDATIYPDASEVPYDGIDQDCDGFDLVDVDGDGFPSDAVDGGTDCDDNNAVVYPEAPEDGGGEPPNYGDDIDNDCDEIIDEGMLDTDDDLDGVDEAHGDCDDNDPGRYPGLDEVPYDGIDQDCDPLQEDLTDVDRDGFDADVVEGGTDCDDNDATTYAGATELCDGKDNDCDETLPDDELTLTFYPDVDADGFGDDSQGVSALACDPPDDTVTEGGDCDDNEAAVYPGAEEICDTLDNDCNPATDENDGETVYPDEDGDGYGANDGGVTASICAPAPEGAVSRDGDCDDTNDTVYQGAPELCDGLDNDCDPGSVEGPSLDLDGDGAAVCDNEGHTVDCDDTDPLTGPGNADWRDDGRDNDCDGEVDNETAAATLAYGLLGDESSATLGKSMDGGWDASSDGFDDLIVGSPRRDDGDDSDVGRAYLRYGASTPPAVETISAHGGALVGNKALDTTGESVALCEDLNGDDIADMVVGTPADDTGGFNRGSAFIFFGTGAPITGEVYTADADVVLYNESSDRSFGRRVRCVGDMDGDGLSELAVAAGGGRVAIYAGSGSWPSEMDDSADDGDDVEGPIGLLTGLIHGTDAGTEVSLAGGDLNGDLLSDLVIGDASAPDSRGRVYVIWGRSYLPDLNGAISDLADVTIDGIDSNSRLGTAVDASGDLNRDGLNDLSIGAPGADADVPSSGGASGRVFVFYGGADSLPDGDVSLLEAQLSFGGDRSGENAGNALRIIPDITGDDSDDLTISGPGSQLGGRVYVISGAATWPEAEGDVPMADISTVTLTGANGDQLGLGLAPLGNFLGSRSGLAVSAMNADTAGDNFGQIHLLEGRDEAPTPEPTPTPEATPTEIETPTPPQPTQAPQ